MCVCNIIYIYFYSYHLPVTSASKEWAGNIRRTRSHGPHTRIIVRRTHALSHTSKQNRYRRVPIVESRVPLSYLYTTNDIGLVRQLPRQCSIVRRWVFVEYRRPFAILIISTDPTACHQFATRFVHRQLTHRPSTEWKVNKKI